MEEFITFKEPIYRLWFLILRTNVIDFQTKGHLVLENITNAPTSFLTFFLFNLLVTLLWIVPKF